MQEHTIQIRVRYEETDAQGHVHHANYLNYFEIGRVEQLRAQGYNYREMEQVGIILVIAKVNCRYLKPAKFDDLLTLHVTTTRARGARIDHEYRLYRDHELLIEGSTTIACVDRSGAVCRLPQWLTEPD